ncbi:MAG: glycosyltransferase family 2 protein [Candidatus Omnitrophica bacterium]|nr:glycosyltransferase family 2 protein [Candidatus Omnitrophota bacterium]
MSEIICDIILPVCDQFEFTKNCVESILVNTPLGFRLIVVNNGTNELTIAYLAGVKEKLGDRLIVIQNSANLGWVKALNQGIAISKAPYLVFQNDDTVVTAGWLTKMIGILERDKRIGIVNPSWEGRPRHMPIEEYGALLESKYRGAFIETDWARGFCVVLKKEVVEKIGNIDEIYGLAYFDDVDFSVRAINAGFLVVLALDTYVYHHRNVTFFEVLKGKKWNELHEKNKLIYYKRWGRPLKVAMVLGARSCDDDAVLDKISETVFYLARKQHHIDIWSPRDRVDKFRHTNVSLRSCGPLTRLASSLELYLNSKKKPEKRYSAVFTYDKSPVEDFDSYVRNTVDALKEKTKESIHG